MSADVIALLMVLAILIVAIFVAKALDRRGKLEVRISQLGDELTVRHVYAEQARHDVRVFLELFSAVSSLREFLQFEHSDEARRFSANLEAFEVTLITVGKRHGLNEIGQALEGYPPAREPSDRELAEIAVIMKVPL